MHERILDILLKEDEITWQSIILELVKSEEMDPWDIDISLLSHKFLGLLRELKEMNLHISGKVVLASAILLKMKTNRLVDQDLAKFDSLIAASQAGEDEFVDELEALGEDVSAPEVPEPGDLIPRTPQPRTRKVSIYDLVEALEKALEVEARRPAKPKDFAKVEIPKKSMDISVVIRGIFQQLVDYLGGGERRSMKFSQLIPSESREDKIYTFIPLLHLTNQRRVDLEQEMHFQDFDVVLLSKEPPDTEKEHAKT